MINKIRAFFCDGSSRGLENKRSANEISNNQESKVVSLMKNIQIKLGMRRPEMFEEIILVRQSDSVRCKSMSKDAIKADLEEYLEETKLFHEIRANHEKNCNKIARLSELLAHLVQHPSGGMAQGIKNMMSSLKSENSQLIQEMRNFDMERMRNKIQTLENQLNEF